MDWSHLTPARNKPKAMLKSTVTVQFLKVGNFVSAWAIVYCMQSTLCACEKE